MRSTSPQPHGTLPKPHIPQPKAQSGIPRCCSSSAQHIPHLSTPSPEVAVIEEPDKGYLDDVYSENQLLGRLLQDVQGKLATSKANAQRLADENAGLQIQLESYRSQLTDLQQDHKALGKAHDTLADKHDRILAQNEQLETVVVDLNLRLKQKDSLTRELQDRCKQLEGELQRLQSSSVTADHVSQQLGRVEAVYRSRVESIKEDCRERLAAQDAAARARLAEAQAATSQMLDRVKRAALKEVQRVEAFLEGKVVDQLRVLDQMSKRCRALEARTADMRPLAAAAAASRSRVAELERRLRDAEEGAAAAAAAPGCCCCCSRAQDKADVGCKDALLELASLASVQQRLVSVRGELAEQVEATAKLQLELAAAQQGRVAAEERLEEVEARCRELRTENVSLRSQLLAVTSAGSTIPRTLGPAPHHARSAGGDAASSVDREAAAHAAALRAAEADAATHALLQAARREQVAASRALLGQLRRMQALETMRLSDLQEVHQLERRLAAALKQRYSEEADRL